MSDVGDLRDLPVVVPPVPEVSHPPLQNRGMGVNSPDACSRQELKFIAEYLVDQDGPRAYRAAQGKEMSDQVARNGAVKWLARPRIARQIQARLDRLLIASDVTAEKVIRELARIGFSDPADIFQPSKISGRFLFKPMDEWPERARRAVAGIKVSKQKQDGEEWVEVVEIKWWPKMDALEELAKRITALVARTPQAPGDVHLHKHDAPNVVMYFPDNGRTMAGANPTNRAADLSFSQPKSDVEVGE